MGEQIMDKPKCRLCNNRHWSGEPCKFEDTKDSAPKDLKPKRKAPKKETPKDVESNDSDPGQPHAETVPPAKSVPTPPDSQKPARVKPSKKRANDESFHEREKRYKREYYQRNKDRLREQARLYMRERRNSITP